MLCFPNIKKNIKKGGERFSIGPYIGVEEVLSKHGLVSNISSRFSISLILRLEEANIRQIIKEGSNNSSTNVFFMYCSN